MVMDDAARRARKSRRRASPAAAKPERRIDYRRLHNPFSPQPAFSDDQIAEMHTTALRILEELGIKVLLPEARDIYRRAGALVDDETEMVRLGREVVESALASAPKSFRLRGAVPDRDQVMELGALSFQAGAGCPHATDRERGRRPGSLEDFLDTVKLVQGFDVLHTIGPTVEPQDVPIHLRHYAMTRGGLTLSDKPCFLYARGTPQVEDGMEMIRLMRGLDRDAFLADAWTYTIINTNSPRTLDIPMAQGLIDFAKAGQMSIVTPFCLAGAMAPITVAGAITLQHAEALAAIALAQLVRPGAPVMYGSFSSNVDMKSGSPAFGTPEHVTATLGSGQLARLIGLPWRAAAASAANVADAQASTETVMSLWACLMAGATHVVHSAGWLEGGLTFSFEKMMIDLEAVQTLAELCTPPPGTTEDIGFDAIAAVAPGGHFFAGDHTMSRYQTAFYEPLVADWSNFGTWSEAGARTADQRATDLWKQKLADYAPPAHDPARIEALDAFIARRTEQGGAAPVS
ncbi:trimethylamine methyltransferase family protein [Hwanghaeella sp.]|uniref:trimethylamine methyltransferase family protein n=1 Tax=Hwanghaeella sp. TaxID=2605943 RepID=UPI003CCB73C0